MAALRVLVADVMVDQVRSAGPLRDRGHEVVSAFNADEAMRAAVDGTLQVVVLAADLPGIDVAGFVRTLRSHPETALIPVIFLGERKAVEELIQGFQLGADDFLAKPVEPRDLEVHVEVANKMREKNEADLRPKAPESMDFSAPSLMTAFRGSLDQVGLPSLLSLIDMERKTGMLVLVLEPGREKARLYFHEGRMMRALFDKKDRPKNADLVYALLAHSMGKFEFRMLMVDPKDEVQTSTPILLLEGARLLDEARAREP